VLSNCFLYWLLAASCLLSRRRILQDALDNNLCEVVDLVAYSHVDWVGLGRTMRAETLSEKHIGRILLARAIHYLCRVGQTPQAGEMRGGEL